MNPPLDFQQNPVEFVKDALHLARLGFLPDRNAVIALMEDWLRLRERVDALRQGLEDCHDASSTVATGHTPRFREVARDALKADDRAALAKWG